MPVINRIGTVLPGFGSAILNDATQLLQNFALSGTAQQTKTLSGISTFTRGMARIKIYAGGGTSPTLANLSIVVSDGTTFVLVDILNGATPVALGTAVGGTQLATNGSITSGAAVLTSATNPFTPANVGQPIAVSGAGAAGAVLLTTVLSYQGPGQVTLAANAGTTVSGTATITLTSAYYNVGVLGTSVGGVDYLIEFMTDLNCTQISLLTTLGGTTPTALMDVDFAGVL